MWHELGQLMKDTKKHLMTGVSYMIPFVVAGGVLLALSVLFSGKSAVPTSGALAKLAGIGTAGLGLMVPILSGYIAYSMADRPGLAPGIIGGYLANAIGAGFIGGIISGLLAGITVFFIRRIKVPSALQSVMPIFIIPLVSTIIVGGFMQWVIGLPIANLMKALSAWLNGLGTGNSIILGLVLGAMIGFDMGGPVNKVAYSFGVAMVGTINASTGLPSHSAMVIMAGIGVAICVPPLAMGVATIVAPKKFTTEERESGKAAIVMGLVGISEGAIPFAAGDPLRVIPANIIGASVASATAMGLAAGNPAPWGGWIVALVAQKPWAYLLASLIGVAITATIVIALKKNVSTVATDAKAEIDDNDDFQLDDLKVL
ncbi:fructose family permease EIIC subunit 2 [Agrilactobacillus composti DSM 18527 = JCM 14202]|uniref:Fructose family permease EIIC subunit 2 n=1 Tax=Agrilactobacillus composti DSM 18527 = JCM 14202 TaxID=1423734 RepID=X0PG60_9LACO|nr:fructose-specific PTS transporter subunit EIIC [Agrilactobacillus composti]KRM30910.1 fructose family permease EIIC subunit 2 [Agrilactobacillus composti DSM 18527 = JCM 14202]GAF40848.1 PTS system, fructose-specific IIA component [Agrilactobacillus composti DSM 18527 = JCM 14202]